VQKEISGNSAGVNRYASVSGLRESRPASALADAAGSIQAIGSEKERKALDRAGSGCAGTKEIWRRIFSKDQLKPFARKRHLLPG
jgi:hypothetical protein